MDSNSLQFFLAQAGGTQATPQPWTMLPMLVLMVVMIGFMFFSQSKKAKQHAAMLKTIKAGDKVMTSSGIIGVVAGVKDNSVTIRSADSKLEFTKSAVAEILERSGDKAETETKS
ncbi:MAG: preprotein translocase subunit YajC [Verrucomicrobiota bacterium]